MDVGLGSGSDDDLIMNPLKLADRSRSLIRPVFHCRLFT